MSRFEHEYPGSRWAIVSIDANALLSPDNIAYYFHTNAAGIRTGKDGHYSADALEEMFSEVVIKKSGYPVDRCKLNLYDNYTTDPQAEVLINGKIRKEYIIHVFFKNEDDYIHALRLCKSAYSNIFKVQPLLFENRHDSNFWWYK